MGRRATAAVVLGAVAGLGGCASTDKADMPRKATVQDRGMAGESGMDSGSMMKDRGPTYTR